MPLMPAGDDVAGAYDRWAASYDADVNPTRDLDALVLRSSGLELGGADVLELGCGTGKNTAWLARAARQVVALDFSPAMLERARSRPPTGRVHFVRHDVRQPWPVRSSSTDAVIGNLVLEHVAELGPIFTEAARVLRPGGRLFLCEFHPFRQWGGRQARFTDPATGEMVHVQAHVHTVSDYVNGGLAAGLRLLHLGETLEAGAAPDALPRLLSLLFQRP